MVAVHEPLDGCVCGAAQERMRVYGRAHLRLHAGGAGLYRSQGARKRLDHEVAPGEIFRLNRRRWEVTDVHPGHSLLVDRRVVARELVDEQAPAA
jgi:hypothetical protein